MSGEVTPTVHGTVDADPQLRHLDNGTPVARFVIRTTHQEYDRAAGRWHDAPAALITCIVRGSLAQHVAASLAPGVHVLVTGTLTIRSEQLRLDATHVGVDLTAHVAYIDTTLPAILAGGPPPAAPPAAMPQPVAAARVPTDGRLADPANLGLQWAPGTTTWRVPAPRVRPRTTAA